ncbi:unnamed protein product [Didymodactylos carnosus]|uniref:MULE transposase domain-containing protein n=2 Tax=Didymodactylos carnosus TaxID=1234261 RepID=A0A815S368_9BILA|nr:unnamed protein product [Didymodactylos carnosus]CAF4347476.1 unnamed protein product [Didymodactylos carnosus]
MSDPSLSRVPPRDHVKRRIRMLRQDKNLPSAPNDPNFASVPVSLTKTLRQDQFLRCDTGAGDDRIMVFGSTEQLDILQSVNDFLVDGTFKLYIGHGIYRGHVVPVLYALLRRKNAVTYQRLINQIVEFSPRWYPRSFMLDFEQACINVLDASFPHIALSGCYFHLRQSIHRQIQKCAEEDEEEFPDDQVAEEVSRKKAL